MVRYVKFVARGVRATEPRTSRTRACASCVSTETGWAAPRGKQPWQVGHFVCDLAAALFESMTGDRLRRPTRRPSLAARNVAPTAYADCLNRRMREGDKIYFQAPSKTLKPVSEIEPSKMLKPASKFEPLAYFQHCQSSFIVCVTAGGSGSPASASSEVPPCSGKAGSRRSPSLAV